MNLLPNFKNAFISIEKLSAYILNDFHPVGKHKAHVFNSALGLNSTHTETLKSIILDGLKENYCVEQNNDEFGKRYNVEMKIRIFDKEAQLITAWIILTSEDFARLTTCFIKSK